MLILENNRAADIFFPRESVSVSRLKSETIMPVSPSETSVSPARGWKGAGVSEPLDCTVHFFSNNAPADHVVPPTRGLLFIHPPKGGGVQIRLTFYYQHVIFLIFLDILK